MVRLALAALCAAVFGAAAVSAQREGDTICVVGADNACPADKLEISKTDSSALVFPGGNTRCAFDDFSNVNYTSNSTFFFQYFPAPETAEKKKLLIYLQGGGACTDDLTCNFALQCSAPTFQPFARALSYGVLNRTQPENVFNDWNIVHVPYCTGDVHIGNRVHGGKDLGFEILLGKPGCLNQNKTVHHNGYNNSMSALNWALANFPEVDQLAIAGSSAGALGAQLFGKVVADMWKVGEKKTKYSVIADSYVGVVPADKPASKFVNYMGACDLPLDLPETVVKNCLNETATVVEMITPILDETTFADWVYINSMGDDTQRTFYELFNQGVFKFPFKDNKISEADFYSNMTAILDQYKDDSSKLTLFFVKGDHHVFLNLDNYTLTPRMDTNETLGAVLETVLDDPATPGSGVPSPSGDATTTFKAVFTVATVAVAAALAL